MSTGNLADLLRFVIAGGVTRDSRDDESLSQIGSGLPRAGNPASGLDFGRILIGQASKSGRPSAGRGGDFEAFPTESGRNPARKTDFSRNIKCNNEIPLALIKHIVKFRGQNEPTLCCGISYNRGKRPLRHLSECHVNDFCPRLYDISAPSP